MAIRISSEIEAELKKLRSSIPKLEKAVQEAQNRYEAVVKEVSENPDFLKTQAEIACGLHGVPWEPSLETKQRVSDAKSAAFQAEGELSKANSRLAPLELELVRAQSNERVSNRLVPLLDRYNQMLDELVTLYLEIEQAAMDEDIWIASGAEWPQLRLECEISENARLNGRVYRDYLTQSILRRNVVANSSPEAQAYPKLLKF